MKYYCPECDADFEEEADGHVCRDCLFTKRKNIALVRVLPSREKAREASKLGLRVWNGGGAISDNDSKQYEMYACGRSGADIIRMIQSAGFSSFTRRDYSEFGTEGLWGDAMEDVKPERGVWIRKLNDCKNKPTKVV
jgi:hypothetical protein